MAAGMSTIRKLVNWVFSKTFPVSFVASMMISCLSSGKRSFSSTYAAVATGDAALVPLPI